MVEEEGKECDILLFHYMSFIALRSDNNNEF